MCYKTHGYYRTWLVLIKYQSPAHFIVSVNSANFKISKQHIDQLGHETKYAK